MEGGWVPLSAADGRTTVRACLALGCPSLFEAEPAMRAGGASRFPLELCAFAVLSLGGLLCPHSGHRDRLSCSMHWRPHHSGSHECARTHAHQLSPASLPFGPLSVSVAMSAF